MKTFEPYSHFCGDSRFLSERSGSTSSPTQKQSFSTILAISPIIILSIISIFIISA